MKENINDKAIIFFIIEETKNKNISNFSQETVKVLRIYFTLI